jgi:ergothioneine biosynthesis protein EgtB
VIVSTHKQDGSATPVEEPPSTTTTATLLQRYRQTRKFTEKICEPLEVEDYVIQTMDDVSPTKWHLAHTSWFFETFLLDPHLDGYQTPDERYRFLFNSYYNTVGAQHYRPHRGFISRPGVADVNRYRAHVDDHMEQLLSGDFDDALAPVVEIGINHEQQHQELMLTDIKHVLSCNPLRPSYHRKPLAAVPTGSPAALEWLPYGEGIREIGHTGDDFAYDNEGPRHRVFLEPFDLASRLVTAAEYLNFINDGGYARPELWLSEGWAVAQERGWLAPLYWEKGNGGWHLFTLSGMRDVEGDEPVTHLSYYEADAYARWAGARLPTEAEWESVASVVAIAGNFADNSRFHPVPCRDAAARPSQLFGDVWEWTASSYAPYPGYRPPEGAIGEYNGKFMCNQYVLRGGSCATSKSHVRATYRNFFPADARWQFSGIRLARTPGK